MFILFPVTLQRMSGAPTFRGFFIQPRAADDRSAGTIESFPQTPIGTNNPCISV